MNVSRQSAERAGAKLAHTPAFRAGSAFSKTEPVLDLGHRDTETQEGDPLLSRHQRERTNHSSRVQSAFADPDVSLSLSP